MALEMDFPPSKLLRPTLYKHVGTGLDRQRLDIDPDRDSDSTFHFDAISALEPDLYNIKMFFTFNHSSASQ
jgi:hypothetical protein